MTIHDKHIELIEAVNNSLTEDEHSHRYERLIGFISGVEVSGRRLNLMEADFHYLDQGIDRPMCYGVWLDWKPAATVENPFEKHGIPQTPKAGWEPITLQDTTV